MIIGDITYQRIFGNILIVFFIKLNDIIFTNSSDININMVQIIYTKDFEKYILQSNDRRLLIILLHCKCIHFQNTSSLNLCNSQNLHTDNILHFLTSTTVT